MNFKLAVLFNYQDDLSPSNIGFLQRLQRVGQDMGIIVSVIEANDYNSLSSYDGLFLRETTYVHPHHTYKFARKAEALDIPVIDDPDSIMLCNNKLYALELWRNHGIQRPRSAMVSADTIECLPGRISFPMVLKHPSSSFSLGVFKAENEKELIALGQRMFQTSKLLLAQEYIYTPFDWRIGVLAGKPLFACKYYMSKNHWQIYKHDADGTKDGDSETVSISMCPQKLLKWH